MAEWGQDPRYEGQKEKTIELPDFKGLHWVWFSNMGHAIKIVLDGAVYDVQGHPLYLIADGGRFYNYSNVISTERITDA